MNLKLHSTDLGDLLAVLPLLEDDAPAELPLTLHNGTASADGTVTGPLDNPRFRGQVSVANASLEGYAFDQFDAAVDLSHSALAASRFTAVRGAMDATGTAAVTASQGGRPGQGPGQSTWNDAGIAAQFNLRNASLEELARELLPKETGAALAVKGTASAGVARLRLSRSPAGGCLSADRGEPASAGGNRWTASARR